MKMYKKTVEAPRLVISYDEDVPNPLQECYLTGSREVILCVDNECIGNATQEELDQLRALQYESSNAQEHFDKVQKRFLEDHKGEAWEVFPVSKYEHGNISLYIGYKEGFDSCFFGYIAIRGEKYLENNEKARKEAESWLVELTQWANGEVYQYELLDENGEQVDACGGFYDLNSIKDYLPEEWKDEDLSKYIK